MIRKFTHGLIGGEEIRPSSVIHSFRRTSFNVFLIAEPPVMFETNSDCPLNPS
jgi:hypothetical protein